jgi:hypothetical protein
MKLLSKILAAALLFASPVSAQSVVVDQTPAPHSSVGPSEILLQSYAVSGGTLYWSTIRQPGVDGKISGIGQSFVPASMGGATRHLSMTAVRGDSGLVATATPGTPTGTLGIARSAGASLTLNTETTSASAVTDKGLWELNLPDSYVAGANVAVTVGAIVTGAGTLTGASTTLTLAAYTEVGGVETALVVSAAQQFGKTAGNYVFTITGTGLTPGAHIALELIALVTSASGANTGVINSISYGG